MLSRASYALEDGRGPLLTGVAAMVINFVLSFAFAPVMEIAGPALASAIAISVAGIGLFVMLYKRLKKDGCGFWSFRDTLDGIKILAAAGIMYVVVVRAVGLFEGYFEGSGIVAQGIVVAGPAVLGAGVYFLGVLLFGVPEVRGIVRRIRKD